MTEETKNTQKSTDPEKKPLKVAWITGASSGIGASLAKRLARHGWNVAITARSEDKLAALEKEAEDLKGSINGFAGDVTKPDEISKLYSKIEKDLGQVTMGVLNAGTYKPDTLENFSAENFRKHTEINMNGTANCLEPMVHAMKDRKSGHIAIVASVAGYRGLPRSLSYGPTKAGLINLAEALAIEGLDYNLKVQVINPGFVETPLTEQNDFKMPFIISPEKAAEYIEDGLQSNKFAIEFPWQMVSMLKSVGGLPGHCYFRAVKKATDRQMG